MKPVTLLIDGINSFREPAIVDFDALARKGVFGIFGETGSGKSTILDCIFLSLFGKTLRTKTPAELVSSVRKEACVEFVFDISNGKLSKRFKAVRTYVPSKNRKDCEMKAQIFEDKKLLAEGTEEVNAKILEIIGFGFNEFQKCFALPQGEYARFIKESAKDKITTIAKIFGLDQYGDKMWKKLMRQISKLEERRAFLHGKLEDYGSLTEAEIQREEDEILHIAGELAQVEHKYNSLKRNILEQEKKLAICTELNATEKQLQQLKTADKKHDEDKHLLKIMKASFTLYPLFAKLDAAKAAHRVLEARLQKTNGNIAAVSNEYFQIVAQNDKQKSNLLLRLSSLERKHTHLLALALQGERIRSLSARKEEVIKKLEAAREKHTVEERKYNEIKESLSGKMQELEEVGNEAESLHVDVKMISGARIYETMRTQITDKQAEKLFLEKRLLKLEAREKELAKELTAQDRMLAGLKAQLHAASDKIAETFGKKTPILKASNKAIKDYLELKYTAEFLLDTRTELLSQQNRQAEIEKQTTQKEKLLEKVRTRLMEFEEEENALVSAERKLLFEREQFFGENLIDFLRGEVLPGETCPVCDQTAQTKAAAKKQVSLDAFDFELENIRYRLNGNKGAREELIKDIGKLSAELSLLQTELVGIVKKQQKKMNVCQEVEKQFTSLKDATTDQVTEMIVLGEETVVSLGNLVESYFSMKDTVSQKEKICVKMSAALDEIGKQKDEIFTLINDNAKALAELNIQGIKTPVFSGGKAAIEKVEEQKEKEDELFKKQYLLLSEITKLFKKQESAALAYEKSAAHIVGLTEVMSGIDFDIQDLTERLKEHGISDISCREEVANNLSEIETTKSLLSDIEKKESDIVRRETALKLEKASILAQTAGKAEEVMQLKEEWEGQLQIAGISEKELLKTTEYKNIIELEKQINKQTAQKTALQADKIRYLAMLNGAFVTETDIVKTRRELDMCEKNYIDLNKKSEVLRVTVVQQRQNWPKISANRTELAQVEAKLQQLEILRNLVQGEKLIRFITDEYIQVITEAANHYLGMLTGGRYVLMYENDFYVSDNLNGGQSRSVGTLSGGETFLASLGLAIAIAETSSKLKGHSLEFIFLDEGFGTLDRANISIVMDAIKNLKNTGFMIGLISHDELVKSQVPCKLEVEKIEGKGSKLRMIG